MTRVVDAPIRAVAFDLDNTLLDHTASARAAIRIWLTERGHRPDADIEDVWMEAERIHYGEHAAGRVDFFEQRRRRLAVALGAVGADPEAHDLDALFAEYLRCYEREWSAFDDVLPTLDKLAGIGMRLAIITNGKREQQEAKLVRLGLLGRFDVVLCLGATDHWKPDAAAFAELGTMLGVPAESVLVVGDDLDADVHGALNAGMRAVWLDRTGLGECPDGATRVTSLADVIAVVTADAS